MTLQECAERYSADKLFNHSYVPHYETIFFNLKMNNHKVEKLLEIGIGFEDLMKPFVPKYIHGASLRMWRDFLPEAKIYGCDNREDTLFLDNRILTYHVDQSKPIDLLNLIGSIGRPDVIIDDGSHMTEHQIISCITLFPYVKKDGYYIIEDVLEPEKLIKTFGIGEIKKGNKRPDDVMVVIKR